MTVFPSPAAIEAAARAVAVHECGFPADVTTCNSKAGTECHCLQTARAALAAAEPLLREMIAQEVEAIGTFGSGPAATLFFELRDAIAAYVRAGGPTTPKEDTDG